MFSIPKTLIALALITSPKLEIHDNVGTLATELHEVSIHLQINDWWSPQHDMPYYLDIYRQRHYDLNVVAYVPRVEEMKYYLPNHDTCGKRSSRASDYCLEVDLLTMWPQNKKLFYVNEVANKRYYIWAYATWCQDKSYSIATRREYLRQMILMVGDRDFFRGKLPSPVPLQHLPWYTPVRNNTCQEPSLPSKKED